LGVGLTSVDQLSPWPVTCVWILLWCGDYVPGPITFSGLSGAPGAWELYLGLQSIN